MVVIDNWMGIYAKFRKWFAGIRSQRRAAHIDPHRPDTMWFVCFAISNIISHIIIVWFVLEKRRLNVSSIRHFILHMKECGGHWPEQNRNLRFWRLLTVCISYVVHWHRGCHVNWNRDCECVCARDAMHCSATAVHNCWCVQCPYLTFSVLKNLSKIFWAKRYSRNMYSSVQNFSITALCVMENCGSIINE